jgi:predicted RNA-binding protein YlxR (DUF448 family)
MARRKHIPQRMCVACRESQDKKSLVRIVRTKEGIFIDVSGKLSGRGAYLHEDPSCWERGIKKSLEKSLNVDFSDQDRDRLNEYLAKQLEYGDQADEIQA